MRASPLWLLFLLALVGRKRVEWGTGWVWPVPTLFPPWSPDGGYDATVSSGFGSTRHNAQGEHTHVGNDVMYRRRGPTDAPAFPAGVQGVDGFACTRNYFAPVGTPILAARAGAVWSVQERSDGGGWSIVLDHGKPWATYYTHLSTVNLAAHRSGKRADGGPAQVVDAGTVLGTMGGNKADSERIRHLHFEAWYQGTGPSASVDGWDEGRGPMSTWERRTWRPKTL